MQSVCNTQDAGLSMPSTSGRPYFIAPRALPQWRRQRRVRPFQSQHAAKAVTERTAQSELVQWLNLPADKTLVTEQEGGLITNKAFTKGTTLLIVPASKWITKETVAGSAVGSHVSQLQGWLQIVVFLMYERTNSRSKWASYMQSLPEQLETPLLWDELEVQELLDGTQLYDSVSNYRSFFSQKFAQLDENVFSQARDTFSSNAFTESSFVWACVTLRSRIHPPLTEDDVALVPLADKVQHQRGRGVEWKLRSGGFGRGEKSLVLEAQRDYQAGESVTMDFEPAKLDSDILLNFGAMDEFVTRAGFPLTLELPEDDQFFDDKADILEINGFQTGTEFILYPGREPGVDMLAFLRLINISGADSFLLESLFRNDVWGFMQMPVSQENESAMFTSMIEGCRGALEGYGSSISTDKAELRNAATGSRQEKALRVRIGEKEALSATLQFFEEKIDRLNQLEYYQERRLKNLGLLDDNGETTYDSFFKDGIA